MWTGTEMLVWGGSDPATGSLLADRDGIAYDPETDSWRTMSPAPFSPDHAVIATWTGHELVVSTSSAAASYDSGRDTWKTLPAPPVSMRDATGLEAAWDGREVVIVVAGLPQRKAVLFDPSTEIWGNLATPLASASPAAADLLGLRGRVVEVAWFSSQPQGLLHAMALDQGSRSWKRLSPLAPQGICDVALAKGPRVILAACSSNQVLSLDLVSNSWRRLPRAPEPVGSVAWTGHELLALTGRQLLTLEPDAK